MILCLMINLSIFVLVVVAAYPLFGTSKDLIRDSEKALILLDCKRKLKII